MKNKHPKDMKSSSVGKPLRGEPERKTVVVIDFETANNGMESACALAMVRVRDDIDAEIKFLIKPPNNYFYHTHIHGICWDDVKNSPTFSEIFDDISEFIEGADYLAAHNASFDRRVLRSCCEHWNLKYPVIPFLCTLRGCRMGLSLDTNSLDYVCSHLNIPLKHHDAASDALAAAKIFLHLQELGLSYADMRIN